MTALMEPKPFGLLSLPPELRNRIFHHVLTAEPHDRTSRQHRLRLPLYPDDNSILLFAPDDFIRPTTARYSVLAMLQTCKQVHNDAEGIFYAINHLSLTALDIEDFAKTVSPTRLHAIRHFTVYDIGSRGQIMALFNSVLRMWRLEHLKLRCFRHVVEVLNGELEVNWLVGYRRIMSRVPHLCRVELSGPPASNRENEFVRMVHDVEGSLQQAIVHGRVVRTIKHAWQTGAAKLRVVSRESSSSP